MTNRWKRFHLIALVVLLAGCDAHEETYNVRYSVTASVGRAIYVVYMDEAGNQQFVQDARLPWSKTFTRNGGRLSVGAVANVGSGRIHARIYVDGREVDGEYSTGRLAAVETAYEL